MLYNDLQAALDRARERASADPSDNAFLIELLQMSAGRRTSDNGIEYRPYYVAARFLRQSRRDQTLSVAEEGVKFTNQATPIADLLDLQRSLDESLIVPIGFEASPAGVSAGDRASVKEAYDAAMLSLKRYFPRP